MRVDLVIWDAKYYRERDSERTPSSPVKRMITDLALLGESYGVLLFAFFSGTPDIAAISDDQEAAAQQLTPKIGADQTLTPQTVTIRQLRPSLNADQMSLEGRLRVLLNDAHTRLAQPRILACHGIFLDTLSVGKRVGMVDRYGVKIGNDANEPADELLICPKPHIGDWHVDLVSRTRHCCKDAQLCHILGQPQARPPVRPPRSANDLLRELHAPTTRCWKTRR